MVQEQTLWERDPVYGTVLGNAEMAEDALDHVGDEVVVQWRGACGAARVELLAPPGTPFAPALEGEAEVVGVSDGTVVVRTWEGCNALGGELAAIEPDGSVILLVPRSGSAIGVRSAVGID